MKEHMKGFGRKAILAASLIAGIPVGMRIAGEGGRPSVHHDAESSTAKKMETGSDALAERFVKTLRMLAAKKKAHQLIKADEQVQIDDVLRHASVWGATRFSWQVVELLLKVRSMETLQVQAVVDEDFLRAVERIHGIAMREIKDIKIGMVQSKPMPYRYMPERIRDLEGLRRISGEILRPAKSVDGESPVS